MKKLADEIKPKLPEGIVNISRDYKLLIGSYGA